MKILYLTNIKPDEFNLLQILAEQYQHEIHLIGGREAYRHATDVTLHDPHNILVNLGKALTRVVSGSRGFFIKHSGLVDQIQPDLIHALNVNTWGVVANALPDHYPLVLTCTGNDIFRYPFQSKRIFKEVQTALQRADLIHVLSAVTVDHLITHFGIGREKIVPSPWGINLQVIEQTLAQSDPAETRASLGFAADDIIVFAPRGVRPEFRPIGDLVEIMAPLMKANPKIKLLFMMHVRTDPELEQKIKEDVRQHQFEDKVVYIERFLPHKEVIQLFQAADVTVSLAESDETSLAAQEAMYCGTIPILSRTLTYPAVLTEGKHAFFVDNGQITAIRQLLADILDGLPVLKHVVSAANKQLIKQDYDRHQNIHKIEQIYQTAYQAKHDS